MLMLGNYKYFLLLIVFYPFALFSQFTDDFSDGNFTENPEWFGDTDNFIVNENLELQLYDEAQSGPSFLVTESRAIEDASWEFLVKFNFNPTSANYANVYLVSNNSNLSEPLNGYYVMLGNTNKHVSLYRQTGTTKTRIIEGTHGRLNSDPVEVRVKVTRDIDGNWTLLSDTLGGTNYYTEGSVFDDTFYRTNYFGVQCVYTSTRWDKFFFDDFVVTGDPYLDTIAPSLISHEIVDSENIILNFDEPLDEESALNTSNYLINNGIGNPELVSFYNSDNSSILLELSIPLQSPNNYILHYQNISDLEGNVAPNASIEFSYFEVEPGMVVINEFMKRDHESTALPFPKYIELHNTSDFFVDISDWKFRSRYLRTIPAHVMSPGEYLILCEPDGYDFFIDFLQNPENNTENAELLLIENGLWMYVSEGSITLYDQDENIMDFVPYNDTYYAGTGKEGGGWSLEKIDPNNHCGTIENWKASEDPRGGTPGFINSVDAPNLDTIPPKVVFVDITAGNEITVHFSQRVIAEDALNIENYEVVPDYGNPILAIEHSTNDKAYILQFPFSFMPNVEYTLIVENISDYCDNVLEYQEIEFLVFNPEPFDVLITEIMMKPSPVVQLPDAEYIEIYNRTEYDINMADWIFTAGSTSRSLPFSVLPSKSYAVLCHENNQHLFSDVENVIGISGFPSIANTGTTLSLQFSNGEYIHTVTYSNTWIKENFKREGGWSLEMIDTNNPCEGEANWRESVDSRGGTPGEENSIKGNNPDIISPFPIAAEAIAPDTVIVWFNEIIIKEQSENPDNYSIDGIGNPVWISSKPPRYSEVKMKFDANFEVGKVYYLNIHDSIMDCSGNLIAKNTSIRFGIPDSVEKGDLVINEILFNPPTGASNFIEIYNKSDKVLDLKKLWISNRNSAGEIANSRAISDKSRLVLPGEYCAITTDNQSIMDHYFVMNKDALFEAASLPSTPNREGYVIISDRYFNILDEVDYNERQHHRLLADVKGVSLERLNYDRPSSDPQNWHSAAQTAGFATPGYKNSQFIENVETTSRIKVYPEVFSPDNDGVDDILNIYYQFDQPGYSVTIAIFSSNGRLIRYIAQNEMVGSDGYFYWDGFDQNDNPAPIGIYVLYMESFSLTGNQRAEKHPFVLSKKKF